MESSIRGEQTVCSGDVSGCKLASGAQTETRLHELEMLLLEWKIHTWGFMNLALLHKGRKKRDKRRETGGKMTERRVHGKTQTRAGAHQPHTAYSWLAYG